MENVSSEEQIVPAQSTDTARECIERKSTGKFAFIGVMVARQFVALKE